MDRPGRLTRCRFYRAPHTSAGPKWADSRNETTRMCDSLQATAPRLVYTVPNEGQGLHIAIIGDVTLSPQNTKGWPGCPPVTLLVPSPVATYSFHLAETRIYKRSTKESKSPRSYRAPFRAAVYRNGNETSISRWFTSAPQSQYANTLVCYKHTRR